MSVTVHEEFPARVKVRRRRSVLCLRQPEAASAPAAFVLLFATGLMAMFSTAAGLLGPAAAVTAMSLAAPAGVATVVTALAIGIRLHRLRERRMFSMIVRIAYIWALFGAVWPLLQIIPAMAYGDIVGLGQLFETVAAMTLDLVAGAVAGGVGGVCGGAAAIALCVERVRP
jgi:hypothetical protein